jgi:hypothetical protein
MILNAKTFGGLLILLVMAALFAATLARIAIFYPFALLPLSSA